MKKETPFIWNEGCQNAFDKIKEYLFNPLVLGAPIEGRPLIFYITALDDSLGALLAQTNDEDKEQPLYYLSRRLVVVEHRYAPMEKMCLTLVFVVKKLRHYLTLTCSNS